MIEPQLLKPAEDWELPYYLSNDNFLMSQKLDGHRTIVATNPLRCYSRTGLAVKVPPSLANSSIASLDSEWIFDGEMLDGTYHCFDILSTPKGDLLRWDWNQRQEVLTVIAERCELNVVRQVHGTVEKARFFQACSEAGVEGVVFVDKFSHYQSGKRSTTARKFKFRKDVDCVVTQIGVDGRDNLELGLYDPDGLLVNVGKVSALTGDGPRVEQGDVVTVTILYVTESRRLYQPVKPRIRRDKLPEDCTVDQLDQYIVNKQLLEE